MLFAIPFGYFVAVFLLVSGVMSGLEFLAARPENCTRAVLLMGLVEAAWPVLAASVVLLLIEIAKQLEKLRFAADYIPESSPSKKTKKAPARKAEEENDDDTPAPRPAPRATAPTQQHSLAGLAAPRPQPAPVAPQPTPAPQYPVSQQPVPPSSMGGKAPVYPNSPIPGGGRVPQSSMTTADPQPAPAAKQAPVAPAANTPGQPQGLSFFKVD